MAIIAAHSLGLFGAVWALMCVLASALVIDELLRHQDVAPASGNGSTGPDRGHAVHVAVAVR